MGLTLPTVTLPTWKRQDVVAVPWQTLPDPVMVHVMRYLNNIDRINAAETCAAWRFAFRHPTLWRHLEMSIGLHNFPKPSDLQCADLCGCHLQSLQLTIYDDYMSHQVATGLLKRLARSPARNLRKIRLEMSYSRRRLLPSIYLVGMTWGNVERLPEIFSDMHALEALLSRPSSESCTRSSLIEVEYCLDASTLASAGRTLQLLAEYHPALEKLTIYFCHPPFCDSPKQLTLNLTHVLRLLEDCRQLTVLDLSLSPPVLCSRLLEALANHRPLRAVSFTLFGYEIRRNAYLEDVGLTQEAWLTLAARLPDLKIHLSIEASFISLRQLLSTYNLDIVDKLNITMLDLAMLNGEEVVVEAIALITDMFGSTLTSCCWEFDDALQQSSLIDEALIKFSTRCRGLQEFYLHGVEVSPETAAILLDQHPLMKANGNEAYLLQCAGQ